MQEQASVIQNEVMTMLNDVARLDQRVENLEKHFALAEKDLRSVRVSAEKVTKRGQRITEIELGESHEKSDTGENIEDANIAMIHRIGD